MFLERCVTFLWMFVVSPAADVPAMLRRESIQAQDDTSWFWLLPGAGSAPNTSFAAVSEKANQSVLNAALRDLQADVGYIMMKKRFRSGLEEIVRAWGYSRQVPIVVTTSDRHYSSFVAPWAKRLKELDLGQQLIVTFDEETSKEVVRAGLPAIDSTGRLENGPRPGAEISLLQKLDGPKRPLPENLPLIKFLVPWQLLEMNFSSVIFSEMDVFLFTNPFVSTLKPSALLSPRTSWASGGCHVADASVAQPVAFDIVGMDATEECMNIGFLQLRGDKIKNALGKFVHEWRLNQMSRSKTGEVKVGADQFIFNQFLVGANLSIGLLPREKFAHRVNKVTANTEVGHLSFANPACKYHILDKLYSATNPTASLLVDTYQAYRDMGEPGERKADIQFWEMC